MDLLRDQDANLPPARLARLREHLMLEIAPPLSRTQEVAPAHRWTPRSAALAAATVAAATAAVLGGLTLGAGPGGLGPSAFAVTPEPKGVVAVHVVSTQASADQMTRQLQAKGLNVQVATVPVSPALVGTWVAVGADGDYSQARMDDLIRQTEGYATTLEIPANMPGEIQLTVGRAPNRGEAIAVGGLRNALAPGGPLACQALSGANPSVAARQLRSLGYTIDFWTTKQPLVHPAGTPASVTGVVAEPAFGSKVTQVWVHDWVGNELTNVRPGYEHHVVVQVQDPRSSTYEYEVWQGFPPSMQGGDASTAGC